MAANLREGTVVPDVPVVGKAVTNKAQTVFLNVLLDGVEGLLLGDLELRIGPARNLDDHVEDAAVLVGEKRDVVEWRNNLLVRVTLDEHTVLLDVDEFYAVKNAMGVSEILTKRVGSADLASGVL